MARPKKQTVDYFPHSSTHGKTIYILEQRYQFKGYAFWFKLLEELCNHEGHFIDLNDETEMEFLSAKTGFLPVEMIEVLNLLEKLNKIDSELWKNKVIWCQNLVNNIADVYRNRKTEIPQKPVSTSNNPVSTTNNRVSTVRNPQSKVKESKVKNIKNILSSNDDFIFGDIIKKMISSKDWRMPIIANYWQYRKISFENKDQYQSGLKRELRAVSMLKGYDLERIKKTMFYLNTQSDWLNKWTLETVHKSIDNIKL